MVILILPPFQYYKKINFAIIKPMVKQQILFRPYKIQNNGYFLARVHLLHNHGILIKNTLRSNLKIGIINDLMATLLSEQIQHS